MKLPPLPQSIALHIGAHKTASSHLQNVLYRNREMLADEGIRVYGPGYLRRPGCDLATMFNLSWSEGPPPARSPEDQLRFLSKGFKRIVFSEENFVGMLSNKSGQMELPVYPMAKHRIAELASKFEPLQPQLFLAVRNPASYLASAYSQTLFGGTYVGPRTFRALNDWRMIDWADYVAQLRAVDGVGDIYVWRQEDYDTCHRLILRRLLRWKVGAKVKTVNERVHEGLSSAAVRQTLAWNQEGREGDLAQDARTKLPINADNKSFDLYSPATIARADEIYADQMARIDALEGVKVLHPPAATQKG